MGGRTIKSSIAVDNGRSTEFIRRREYPDKSMCWECGEEGHLSYKCTQNTLGARNPPPKKVRVRKKNKSSTEQSGTSYYDSDSDDGVRNPRGASESQDIDENEDLEAETLSAAIRYEQEQRELESYRYKVATGQYDDSEKQKDSQPRKRFKKNEYFSDEEELSDHN
uniref:CCHC-type domain-containing protein n=1 Tax=Bracon brevicornis TaxID=1563983 RepID=A0A6V7I4A4_9HYME